MNKPIDAAVLDQLLVKARSQHGWLDRPVTDDQLRAIHDIWRWGPTSANGQPQRILFLRSPAKERIRPALRPRNVEKTLTAPVVAILAYDLRFFEIIPHMYARNPKAGEVFARDPQLAEVNALRNASLQGAYFMIASRALGLDVGPMSGFDNAKVDAEFFPDGRWKSNFICALGYGDPAKLDTREPRLTFEKVCKIL